MLDELLSVVTGEALDKGALFSPCMHYRYLLWRRWDRDKPVCAFVALNPSTADEREDDPTVRRMIGFAKSWGYGAVWVLNAYAFRATDPARMKAHGTEAVGPQNDDYLTHAAECCECVVAAWGVHCDDVRQQQIFKLFAARSRSLYALGLTKDGRPRHPLYLRRELRPLEWVTSYQGIPIINTDPFVADVPRTALHSV